MNLFTHKNLLKLMKVSESEKEREREDGGDHTKCYVNFSINLSTPLLSFIYTIYLSIYPSI